MLIIYEGFDEALDRSFNVIDRSDATASFSYTASDKAILELQRIEGVTLVEPFRQVPVILRNGLHSHQGAITGLTNGARLYRALDSQTRPIALPDRGIVLSTALASVLDVEAGENILVEVREGRQPILSVPVTGIAESLMGAPAFMELTALSNLLGEQRRVSGAYLAISDDNSDAVYEHLRDLPVVAGISMRSEAERAFKEIMDQGAGSSRYIMGIMAFAITFGIVFNAASVAHAERARDLASLRVIGFHRRETAFVLLGELAIVTLIALPIGLLLGNAMSFGIAAGFSTELYQIPVIFAPRAQGFAIVGVVTAALASGWLVKRKIDRADIISTLKTRE
jgi:putative ABC transport system permease protein